MDLAYDFTSSELANWIELALNEAQSSCRRQVPSRALRFHSWLIPGKTVTSTCAWSKSALTFED